VHAKAPDANQQRATQGAPGGRDNVGVAPPTPGFGAGFPFPIPMMPGFPQPQYPGYGGAQPQGGGGQ
jgi:protein NRD1